MASNPTAVVRIRFHGVYDRLDETWYRHTGQVIRSAIVTQACLCPPDDLLSIEWEVPTEFDVAPQELVENTFDMYEAEHRRRQIVKDREPVWDRARALFMEQHPDKGMSEFSALIEAGVEHLRETDPR